MTAIKAKKTMFPVAMMAGALALLFSSMPAGASQTDDRIESSAKQSYVFKTYLKNDAITIASKDGAVTLTGTVNDDINKSLAKETVVGLPGVKSVDNQIKIKGDSPTENSDAWVSAKVTTSLLFHRNVSGTSTEVSVKEGIVTLRGDATSQAQKDLATEYVKDVVGVKDVKNEMTVPPTPAKPDGKTISQKIDAVGDKIGDVGDKIDDASITALVKMTLLYHRSTSALNTKVETNDGVVTLTGKAKNASEKDLAVKFVKDVRGVTSVKNQMTIE